MAGWIDMSVLIKKNGDKILFECNGESIDGCLEQSNGGLLLITGRIVRDSGGIVSKTKDGRYCTPVLHENSEKEIVTTKPAVTYYRSSGERVLVKPGSGYVRFPTVVNNSFSEARYYSLFAFGENATILADTKRGDFVRLMISADPKMAKVDDREYPVYIVHAIDVQPKGGAVNGNEQ